MAFNLGWFLNRAISQMYSYNICAFFISIFIFSEPCLAAQCPGTSISENDISRWNIDISKNSPLPSGSGTPLMGKKIYLEKCAACHGETGEGMMGIYPALSGGIGSLATTTPLRTVGSFWPYPESVLDYVRRAMPLNAPQSLNTDDLYSVVSYLFYMNHIIPQEFSLNEKTIHSIKMPNKDGFINEKEENINKNTPRDELRSRLGICLHP